GLDHAAGAFLDVGLVGRELGDQRLAGHGADRFHHPGRHVRVVAELHAAFLDVRAGDVDLHGADGRVVEAPRHRDVFLDGGAGDVGDEARLAEVQCRQDVFDDVIHARVLQANGVEHAGRRLVDTVRRVAEA